MKNTTDKGSKWCKLNDAYHAMLFFTNNAPTELQFEKKIEEVKKMKISKVGKDAKK